MYDMIKSEVVVFTPEIARQYLEMNTQNRIVKKTQVDNIANVIRRGEWSLTHQGIAISKDNVILDGQHRLLAIIETNATIPIMVTRGFDREQTFSAIDGGFCLRTDADRTGIPKKTIEVIKFILNNILIIRTGAGRTRKLTPGQLKQMDDVIGLLHYRLMLQCSSNARFISCATSRAAAIISVLLGESEEYVFGLYKKMIVQSDDLPPIAWVIISAVTRGEIKQGADTEYLKNFARMIYVFNHKNANKTRFSTKNHLVVVDAVRVELTKFFPFLSDK